MAKHSVEELVEQIKALDCVELLEFISAFKKAFSPSAGCETRVETAPCQEIVYYPSTRIEIVFSEERGAVQARSVAETMISVYCRNDYEFLPFDDMKLENADGWLHYPSRRARYESVGALQELWRRYQMEYRGLKASGTEYTHNENAQRLLGPARIEGSRIVFCESIIGQTRDVGGRYFEDFFSMLCFFLAVKSPEIRFEGMIRTDKPCAYEKKSLTHAVYDGASLSFEQMEGEPAYAFTNVSWTRRENRFVKEEKTFPFISVYIDTNDRDGVKRDAALAEWVRRTNDVQMEMVSAKLCFLHATAPHVMLHASSRRLCEKYRDELLALLADRGYQTSLFSILTAGECSGPYVCVPDSVTKIGDKAFRDDALLERVEIPDSVFWIGEDAFRACSALEEISIPDSVTEIDSFAFFNCTSLKTVRLSEKLKKLSVGLFCGCGRLEGITIPGRVTEIERYAFSACENLKSVSIPEALRKIDDQAFKGCKSLESVTIPERVTKIGREVFVGCSPALVICGKKGSAAERYAADNGIAFSEMK